MSLKAMKERFGDKIYGRYGFTDAFHPTNGWASADVLGLEVIGKEAGRHAFFRVGVGVLLAFRPEATLKGDALPAHGARGPGHFALGVRAEDRESAAPPLKSTASKSAAAPPPRRPWRRPPPAASVRAPRRPAPAAAR